MVSLDSLFPERQHFSVTICGMRFFKATCLTLTIIFFFFIFSKNTKAIVNPKEYPNNRFGIHILNTVDITKAAELVNSSGGDWGYVTMVIQENDRNIKKWQKAFNDMRKTHLIPIIRIASSPENNNWKKLDGGDIDNWIYFLNSLNWVIKNRYIVVGNEPNHATEWGGEVNPQEYSDYFILFSQKLKEASQDFFVISAPLDASAPDNKEHISEVVFLQKVLEIHPNFFEFSDGFASHSYPNPDFSGSEDDTGQGSIRTYAWEMGLLKSLNISKDFPIFITETGWAHDDVGNTLSKKKTTTISEKYIKAFATAWNDSRIVAVTPFVFDYQDEPFYTFSWKNKEGNFFPFFEDVKNIQKIKGLPLQEENGEISFLITPKIARKGNFVKGFALIKNTGQSIWEENEVDINEEVDGKVVNTEPITANVEPGQKLLMKINIYLPETSEGINGNIKLARDKKTFGTGYPFQILALKSAFSNFDIFNELRQIIIENPLNLLFREFKLNI